MSNHAEPDRTPARSRGKRLLIWLGAAVAVLVLLAAVAAVLLHTPVARRFVRDRLSDFLRERQMGFSAQDLDYNLLTMRVTLRDVELASLRRTDLPAFLHADRITVNLSALGLLRGRYVVEDGEADGLFVRYVVQREGVDNLPGAAGGDDAESGDAAREFLIDRFEARQSRVLYVDGPSNLEADVPIPQLLIDGSPLDARHTVVAHVQDGAVSYGGRSYAIDRVDAELDAGANDLHVERVSASGFGIEIEMAGRVEDFSDPIVSLDVQGRVDVPRAALAVGVDRPLAGRVSLDTTIEGPLKRPVLSGRVEGQALAYGNLTDIDVTADTELRVGERQLQVRELDVRAPVGRASGRTLLALGDSGESRIDLLTSDLQVAPIMEVFDLSPPVATAVDGRVAMSWPAMRYEQASGEASLDLAPARLANRSGAIPLGGEMELTARAGSWELQLARVEADGLAANGRVRVVDGTRLGGVVRLNVTDASRALASVETALSRPAGSLRPVELDGAIEATVRLAGTTNAPQVTAQVSSPALTIGAAEALALNADVSLTPDLLRLQSLEGRWGEATFHGSGTVGLGETRPLRLAVDARNLAVAELLRAAGASGVDASGAVSLQGDVAGTVDQPTADLTVDAVDLVAYNERWGRASAGVTVTGTDVVLADLALDKPQPAGAGRLTGRATYDLDRRTFEADLESDGLELTGLRLPGGKMVRGGLELRASLIGEIDRPRGRITLAATGLSVDQRDLGHVVVDAALDGDQVALDATAPKFGVTADADIGMQAPHATTADVRIDQLPLESLPLGTEAPLTGRLQAHLRASGPLDEPGRGTVSLQLAELTGSWQGETFGLAAPTELSYADERISLDDLIVTARDSRLRLSGEWPVDLEGAGAGETAAAEGVLTVEARADLASLLAYAPSEIELTGSGELTLDGDVRGTSDLIRPNLTLRLSNGALSTADLTPGLSAAAARVQVRDGAIALEQFEARFGEATITGTATAPLAFVPSLPFETGRTAGPASVTARVSGLSLAELPGAPEVLGGTVALEADLSADRPALAELTGRVVFETLDVTLADLTLGQQRQTVIAFGDGEARLDPVTLSGTLGQLDASGRVGLAGDRALSAEVNGAFELGAVGSLTDEVTADGTATMVLAASGTVDAPDLSGSVEVDGASFLVDEPTFAGEAIDARLGLSGRRITVDALTGSLNGGTLDGSGFIELGEGVIADADLRLTASEVANDFPLELRSLSDSTLHLTRRDGVLVLEGTVRIDEAGQTGDINFDEGILAAIATPDRLDLTEQPNPLLENLRFDIAVETKTPILVENNLARAEVTTDLRVLGTPASPGLSGQLVVLEGGEVTLSEQQYEVERGVINFIGEREIVPSMDLLLHTEADGYDVRVAVTGTPGDTETALTSEPTLPEPDIMALLVTGRTIDEMRGEEFEVAKEQVLSYLAGRVGSRLGRGLEEATGLSTVRVEPDLIANETDPGARLTVGQEITRDLELVYSVDLTNSNDQIWLAQYDITRRFRTNLVRQADDTYRFDLRHDVRFGGRASPDREPHQPTLVSRFDVVTDGSLSEAELREIANVDVGDEFDYFAGRNAVSEIEDRLAARDRLQSRVRLERDSRDHEVALTLHVEAGPRVEMVFEGATPPDDVVEEVRRQWQRGVFDAQRLDDSEERLEGWLMRDRYLQCDVTGAVVETGDGQRRVRFSIDPGPRAEQVVLAFEGASGVSPDVLREIVDEQRLELPLFTDPVQVTELLGRYYREQGFLAAELRQPRYEFDGGVARVIVPVSEGPRFTVGATDVSGNTALGRDALLGELPLIEGDPYSPRAVQNSLRRIRDLYWARGYNEVRPDVSLTADRETGRVDIAFSVEEGRQSVVAEVDVQGTDRASPNLVTSQVGLDPGQPLDLKELARSRSSLYATRAFSLVDIERNEQPASADGRKPVDLTVAVREVQPFQLRYGASFDTERGLGGIVDVSSHNMLGGARVVGLRGRYDSQVRDGRIYFSQPALRSRALETTASLYYREDRSPDTTTTERFVVERQGVSIQQERRLGNEYVWNYGYRYERARSVDPLRGGLDERVTVSPLGSTFTRETRDAVLDSTRGSFSSHAFQFSPTWLGSDQTYLKYFGQYFHYFPLRGVRRERLTGELLKPRFVFATGVRVGLAHAPGGDVPVSERFFAGGSTTLRGFEQNAVGPIRPDGIPLGGEAILVLNNELRFPLVSIVDGVAFVDVGGVFPRVSLVTLDQVRESGGVGVRVRTPWFLGRLDYGWPFDRRPGERRGRFYFSIGQAF